VGPDPNSRSQCVPRLPALQLIYGGREDEDYFDDLWLLVRGVPMRLLCTGNLYIGQASFYDDLWLLVTGLPMRLFLAML